MNVLVGGPGDGRVVPPGLSIVRYALPAREPWVDSWAESAGPSVFEIREVHYARRRLAMPWPVRGWELWTDDHFGLRSGLLEPWWTTVVWALPDRFDELDKLFVDLNRALRRIAIERALYVEMRNEMREGLGTAVGERFAALERTVLSHVDELVALTTPGRP